LIQRKIPPEECDQAGPAEIAVTLPLEVLQRKPPAVPHIVIVESLFKKGGQISGRAVSIAEPLDQIGHDGMGACLLKRNRHLGPEGRMLRHDIIDIPGDGRREEGLFINPGLRCHRRQRPRFPPELDRMKEITNHIDGMTLIKPGR